MKSPTQSDILTYFESPVAFAKSGYVWINDPKTGAWIHFDPWPHQIDLLNEFHKGGKIAVPKARQLGVTTTAVVFALWKFRFDPIASIGIFSIGGREAKEVLKSIKGAYSRLPKSLKAAKITKSDQVNGIFQVSAPNGDLEGSIIRSLPATAGEGLTMNTIIYDEAGRQEGYKGLIGRTMPTIEDVLASGRGTVIACGIYDKRKPNLKYRSQILDGIAEENGWRTIFLPWYSRPDRDEAFYEKVKQELDEDELKQQYPATIEEMLSASISDRRISAKFLDPVYEKSEGVEHELDLPGLTVFSLPDEGQFIVTVDCAEGTPTSDESVSIVARVDTGEQVAILAGLFTPEVHAGYTRELAVWFNYAKVLPERNNHGLVFISEWENLNAYADDEVELMEGKQGKGGWFTSHAAKTKMYHDFVKMLKEGRAIEVVKNMTKNIAGVSVVALDRGALIHDEATFEQLSAVKASTLKAPEGQHDDRAIAMALVGVARDLAEPSISSRVI